MLPLNLRLPLLLCLDLFMRLCPSLFLHLCQRLRICLQTPSLI
jgi:hypothetical protein